MARQFQLLMPPTAVSAVQDLFFFPGATGKLYRILRHWIGVADTTLATGQGLSLRSRLLPAAVTAGTGGTTGATPTKVDPGSPTCSVTTAGLNNTTKATTSGTAVLLYSNGVHLFQGDNYFYPEDTLIAAGEAFVFEILGAPSGTVTLAGGLLVAEMGG